ncbi:MAG: DNA-binding protein [Spirochaetaceae bacterium]|nr:DNA-binding protein [Spirochaetaceae bacterium]
MHITNIKPIRSEADYDMALTVIDRLMGAEPDTPERDEMEVLVTLVEAYEAKHWPIEPPDPISAIEHVMEARGLRQKDLAELIGSQPHASEVLSRRRPLTLAMIRTLSREWKLPADMLVREYDLVTTS